MVKERYNLLFICHDNAVYSPVAEALLRKWSDGQFTFDSAGIIPASTYPLHVRRFLKEKSLPQPQYRPRPLQLSWSYVDYIFLLDERLPSGLFAPPRGQAGPVIIDWRLPVPVDGDDPESASQMMRRYYATLEHRIRVLTCTPVRSFDQSLLNRRIVEIARFNRVV